MKIEELKKVLENEYLSIKRGTYRKAITLYASEIADNIGDHYTAKAEELANIEKISPERLKDLALNGADNWGHYSWGGCSLCYNGDILERIFCPSMAKKYENADRVRGVHLLDLQAYALNKAFNHIKHIIKVRS